MSARTILVGALAMICGVTAALGVSQYLQQPQTQAAPTIETLTIPVATFQIQRGDKILETMIAEKAWPKDMLPEGVLLDKEEILGKIAQSPLFPSEPFLAAKIGDTERFSGFVKEGMRAYTILTPNDASLVAGLITPGDKVDVLFTDRKTQKEYTGGGSTTPLLQNIEVMAVGHDLSETDARTKDVKDMRSVTLAVTLDMATKLALAQELGSLHLALRSEQDSSTADVAAITLNELMRTMYPALHLEEASAEAEVDDQPLAIEIQKTSTDELRNKKDRKELLVRTLRGFVPGEMVMLVSEDGKRRFHETSVED